MKKAALQDKTAGYSRTCREQCLQIFVFLLRKDMQAGIRYTND